MWSIIGTLGGVALKFIFSLFVPSKDRILGRKEAELEGRRKVDEVEKKINNVLPSSESNTVNSLRDGNY